MLIDLRELLSGSQDEKSYKADIEMNTFNTGSSDYDIIDKPAVDVIRISFLLRLILMLPLVFLVTDA